MDKISQDIGRVVAILTAIISEQEDMAYEMVLESDPIELFSSLTGVLLSALNSLSNLTNVSTESYLKDLGMLAFRTQ
jgi:hypothetical protein